MGLKNHNNDNTMNQTDYWMETISQAADECELSMTPKQLMFIAEAVKSSHENYGMAFYTPPASDRYADIEREWKAKLRAKEKEFEHYRSNAETAVKRALRQHSDAHVSIGAYGEVTRHEGRDCRIQ